MESLEMPTDVVCPLCRANHVELRENKAGNPYFNCAELNATVNLRPETETSKEFLHELREAEPSPEAVELFQGSETTVSQPDDGDDEPNSETEGPLLEEMLEGDDDE
jgi:hypothetical protein